jgi:parvulin-like peptidyl-prolyl isomerase
VNNTQKALVGLGAAVVIGAAAAGGGYMINANNSYVATVNGEKVSVAKFNRAMEGFKRQMPFPMDDKTPEGKRYRLIMQKNVIDQLCEVQVILSEAKKRHIEVTPAEIDAKLATVKKNFPDETKFQEALKQYGISVNELKDQIHDGMAIEKLQAEVTKDTKVSDAELQTYYNQHLDQFKKGEEVSASHILIKDEKEAKDVLAKLKKGEDFAKLAKEHSIDPGSKVKGGDLGFFGRGMMVPEFEKAAFTLKKGELSGLIKTQFGYHIIKGGEHKMPRTETFADVKTNLCDQMMKQRQTEAFQKWAKDLKKTAKIVVKPQYNATPEPMPSAPAASAAPVTTTPNATK